MPLPARTLSAIATVLVALASSAQAATRYVSNNGSDGPSHCLCGGQANPCRSISCAVHNAAADDKVVVDPGRYGDLDGDGTPGDSAGEENPAPGCGCMLAIDKPITVTSSSGAAATVIDARTANVDTNVLIITGNAGGGEFGKPGKGFTVTNTAKAGGDGIVIDSTNVKVRGNQVVSVSFSSLSHGIETVDNSGEIILIANNQVIGWDDGIVGGGAGKTISNNQVSMNSVGIEATGGTVTGNVATANSGAGIAIFDAANGTGNAVRGNLGLGFDAGPFFPASVFTGTVEKNDVIANRVCGLRNGTEVGVAQNLPATNNFWGAATGPGPDPADDVCNDPGGSTVTTPFATKPFKVKATIKP